MHRWINVYRELAIGMMRKYHVYGENIGLEYYNRLRRDKEFVKLNRWFERSVVEFDSQWVDPIQIFASFNGSMIGEKKRLDRIRMFYKQFGVEWLWGDEQISFEGCPSPVTTKIINSRNDRSQKEIWKFFETIVHASNVRIYEGYAFELMRNWYGVELTSLTIFMFWIQPEEFLPLDKNSVQKLESLYLNVESRPRNFESYIKLSHTVKYNYNGGITRFVEDAYKEVKYKDSYRYRRIVESNEIEQNNEIISSVQRVTSQLVDETPNSGYRFQLIALKTNFPEDNLDISEREIRKYCKALENQRFYYLTNEYEISKNGEQINYFPERSYPIYNMGDNLEISVSAIVGRNGSGKSTISELLYLIINQLSRLGIKSSNAELIGEDQKLYAELYFMSDKVYRIRVEASEVRIDRYRYNNMHNRFERPFKLSPEDFDFEKFFYTIALNYSHYGLNSENIGDWINPLFHKNDAYQIPIVLNPWKDKGNYNINEEDSRAKQRIVGNVLNPDLRDADAEEYSFELLPEKYAKHLYVWFNEEKYIDIRRKVRKIRRRGMKYLLIKQFFKLVDLQSRDFYFECMYYLLYKIDSISKKYMQYAEFKRVDKIVLMSDFVLEFKKLLKEIAGDTSHITFKIRQTINYLKLDTLLLDEQILNNKEYRFDIDDISRNIQKLIINDNSLKPHYLIPPPIFETDIEFRSSGERFNGMSSGEKQKAAGLNTVLYHLINIDSVREETDLIKYRNVLVVFDEIELYYHPEMQRTFISDFLDLLQRIKLEGINGIQFVFITHSPFIISDIPKGNVIFLKSKNGISSPEAIEKVGLTFGANIHDMLIGNFFMESTIGEFASKQIDHVVKFYEEVKKLDEESVSESQEEKRKAIKIEFEQYRPKIDYLIEQIGEPVIKGVLRNHVELIEDKLLLTPVVNENTDWRNQRIALLESYLSNLKGE